MHVLIHKIIILCGTIIITSIDVSFTCIARLLIILKLELKHVLNPKQLKIGFLPVSRSFGQEDQTFGFDIDRSSSEGSNIRCSGRILNSNLKATKPILSKS
jgi:hypothetical protein